MENIKFLVVEPERGHHNYIIEKLQSRAYQNISVIEHLNELKYFTEDELPDIMIYNYKLGDNYTIHHVFEINTLLSTSLVSVAKP